MTLEQFQREFDAKLAAISDADLQRELEAAGCVFDEPWLISFDELEVGDFPWLEELFSAANSNELALAA